MLRRPRPDERIVRASPAWFAALLTLATGGLYLVVWAGLSWAIMKRARGDAAMRPVGHALSLAVPFYMVFRARAHFATINDLLQRAGVRERANVPLALAAFVGIPAALFVGGDPRLALPQGLPLLGAAACAAVVAGYGQHHLIRAARADAGSRVVVGIHPLEWLAFVASGALLIGYLTSIWLAARASGAGVPL